MITAIAYVRVSTEEQAAEGCSLEAQAAAIRAYAAMRGLSLIDIVIDAGVSAGKPLAQREGGRRILEAVRRGEVRAVVALKLDRLFRDASDCLAVTSTWDKAGAALHLIDMGGQAIDTSSAMGRFFLTVLAGAAEMERNLIRERTRGAMAHMKATGARVGQIPFGSRLADDGTHLVGDDAEQRVIGIVRSLRAAGLSIRAIADRLNADGVPARGARWHATSVARVLAA